MTTPTIKQICEMTGLSKPTVSQILGNKGHLYKTETNERVLAAARQLGYRPNSSARAISTGRFDCIALLSGVHPSRSSLFSGLIDGIQDALGERDMHLTLTRLSDEGLTSEWVIPKILRESSADGLLINYQSEIPDQLIELIERHGIPAIWLNTRHQNHDCVSLDDLGAGRQAAEYLLQLGHRRISFAAHWSSHYSLEDRRDGYFAAMRAVGREPEFVHRRFGVKGWVEHAQRWLASPGRPTGIIAYSPFTAQPILFAALSLGLRVPEDLSIITFDEQSKEDPATGQVFSILELPTRVLGRAAVEMLLTKIEHPSHDLADRVVPMKLIEGETCGSAP